MRCTRVVPRPFTGEKAMPELRLFEFTDEIVERFRREKTIPVDFYNKDGQVLIGKVVNASDERIEKLFHFMHLGIYYRVEDSGKLGIKQKEKKSYDAAIDTLLENKNIIPSPTKEHAPVEGLTNTRLLADIHVKEMTARTSELFDLLKTSTLKSAYTKSSREMMDNIFRDFNEQPDAMVGLINILELMKDRISEKDVAKTIKRIVTAMALKTRGMRLYQSNYSEKDVKNATSDLMMSALFCDIGYFKMDIPSAGNLNTTQMNYIRNHPVLSYLMVIHDLSLGPRVKYNILNHHRPHNTDNEVNNYPSNKALLDQLESIRKKFDKDAERKPILDDIERQMELFKRDDNYKEDANILAISSEFASLTSDTEWRKAFSPRRAVQMIINNSYFTYPFRIVREFLDYVSLSLCSNERIMRQGDYIIVASVSAAKKVYFELCRIDEIGRYQSRPVIERIGTVRMKRVTDPKLRLEGFSIDTLQRDPRKAHYDLGSDDTKNIIYTIDPEFDRTLYHEIAAL